MKTSEINMMIKNAKEYMANNREKNVYVESFGGKKYPAIKFKMFKKGKIKTAHFSIKKYGIEKAAELAFQAKLNYLREIHYKK